MVKKQEAHNVNLASQIMPSMKKAVLAIEVNDKIWKCLKTTSLEMTDILPNLMSITEESKEIEIE